ncbi:polysaccharide deacetylase family protein [Roseicyclus persicicus]|uniref:Chitooligosaccharide deacetylase n=1 Tax=Roseicyclus persicicus TaxID=2650661 RepID=A0A7X6H3G7_9RHOB|nr:polysaccharide deacetylase family protein [Roseibacterium persicicum]NKX46463.1 polysaccharide deacetylase family protein [Roseibacterium persicicum]
MLAAPALARPAQAQQARAAAGPLAAPTPITVTRVRTARPVLALTFDDGPHPTLTPELLDMLAARDIRATFFVIGNRVARQPELTRRIADEGHEIGNHTWSHPSLFGLSDAALLSQLDRTSVAIDDAVGRPPVTMRPPYGNLYPRQRALIHAERNLPTVLWSVDPEDWRRPGSAAVASRILGASHPGALILAHDIIAATVRAMPATLDGLIARGYQFVTVSELIGWPRWDSRNLRLAARS